MWGMIIVAAIIGIIAGILIYNDGFWDWKDAIWGSIEVALIALVFGLLANLIVVCTAKCEVESVVTYAPVAVETYHDGAPKYYYEFEDAWGFAVEQEETKKLEKIIAPKNNSTVRESDERKVEVYTYNYKSKVLRFFFIDINWAEYVIYGPKNEVTQSFKDLE